MSQDRRNPRPIFIAVVSVSLFTGKVVRAGVPEPPHLVYGATNWTNGTVGAEEDVTAIARVDAFLGQVVGEYPMGARTQIRNLYYLPVRPEALADGRPQSADAALLRQTVTIYVRHGPPGVPEELARFAGGQPAQFVLNEAGTVERRDLTLDCCCNTSADGNWYALCGDVTNAGGLIRPGSNCALDLFNILCELDGDAGDSAWIPNRQVAAAISGDRLYDRRSL